MTAQFTVIYIVPGFILAQVNTSHTVLLKSKLPVSSRFSRDESRVSRYKILISRDESPESRLARITEAEILEYYQVSREKKNRPSFSCTCLMIRKRPVPTVDDSVDMYVRIVRAYVIRNNFVFIQFKYFDSCTM